MKVHVFVVASLLVATLLLSSFEVQTVSAKHPESVYYEVDSLWHLGTGKNTITVEGNQMIFYSNKTAQTVGIHWVYGPVPYNGYLNITKKNSSFVVKNSNAVPIILYKNSTIGLVSVNLSDSFLVSYQAGSFVANIVLGGQNSHVYSGLAWSFTGNQNFVPHHLSPVSNIPNATLYYNLTTLGNTLYLYAGMIPLIFESGYWSFVGTTIYEPSQASSNTLTNVSTFGSGVIDQPVNSEFTWFYLYNFSRIENPQTTVQVNVTWNYSPFGIS